MAAMRLGGRCIRGNGDEVGGHEAAGAVRLRRPPAPRISAASSGLIRIRISSAVGVGKLFDDVRRVVGVHLFEQLGCLGLRQGTEDSRRLDRGQLLEEADHLLVGQPLHEDGHFPGLELGDEVSPLRRPDALGEAAHALFLALPDERLHLGQQLAGLD